MKNFPAPLLAYLQANTTGLRVDLIKIQLSSGQTIYACANSQVDITVSGTTYYATKYGNWSRGTVTSNIGTSATTMDLDVSADVTILTPGTNVSILQGIALGLFDGALVTVYTAYGVTNVNGINIPDVSMGLETKFVGEETNIAKMGRTSAKLTISDMRYRFNDQSPRNLIQTSCRHTLFDSGCTLSKASFVVTFTAAGGSTQLTVIMNPIGTHPANYFNQGVLTGTSGANNGLSQTVRSYNNSTGAVTLVVPLLFPVSIGDGFSILPGCDKSMATCNGTFSNLIHYGGMPYVPIPETVL